MKSIVTVSVDSDVLRLIKEIHGFNLSKFVNEKLKQELETRELLK